MKMRNLFLIPLFALSMLSGCTPSEGIMSTKDILEQASRFGSLVVNGTTGSAYPDRTMDIKLSGKEFLIVARTYTVRNVLLEKDGERIDVVVAVSYSVDEESTNLWKVAERNPDKAHDKLTPEFPSVGEDDYFSVLTATFKLYYEKDVEAVDKTELKVSWNIFLRAPVENVIDTTIANIRNGTTTVKVGEYIRVKGYITDHFYEGSETDTQVFIGTFIADGNRAITLYGGKLSKLWFNKGTPTFQVGDLVEAVAKYNPLDGLVRIEPNTLKKVVDATILQPVNLVITDAAQQWNATYLLGHDGRMTKFDNLIFKSANLKTVDAHGELKFTAEGTEIEVTMAINYRMGSVEKQKIHDMVDDWTAGVTKINYTGILSWKNNPILGPTDASCIVVES